MAVFYVSFKRMSYVRICTSYFFFANYLRWQFFGLCYGFIVFLLSSLQPFPLWTRHAPATYFQPELCFVLPPEYYHTDSSYSCQYSTGSMATHSFPAFLMVYEVLFPIKKCGRSFESSWYQGPLCLIGNQLDEITLWQKAVVVRQRSPAIA